MAYSYCECGQGFDEPTTRQALGHSLDDGFYCPSCGGRFIGVLKSHAEVTLEVVDKLEDLEHRVIKLENLYKDSL